MARNRSLILLAALLLGAGAPAPFTEIVPGVHVRQGAYEDATAENADAICNAGFIEGRDSVAVIDPGGSLTDGMQIRAAIRTVTAKPIAYVIMTHMHPDHVFGAGAFLQDHPVFVGSARLPASLAERAEYYKTRLAAIVGAARAGDVVLPTKLVSGTAELDLGDRILDLHAWGAAHTDNDLTVLDRTTATLFAGDLLFVHRIPSIDDSLQSWRKTLKELEAVPAARAVPGHGPVSLPWPAAAEDEERYFQELTQGVRAMLAKGEDIEAAIPVVGQAERDRWVLFDEYNGRNVTKAFKELEWE